MPRFDFLTGKVLQDPPKRKRPEASVGRTVDDFLRLSGAYIRQINSSGTMRNSKWARSAQGSGISDRIGVLPGGRFLAVELKAPGRKRTLSDSQFNFLHRVASLGGMACVADCLEDVSKALKQTQAELLAELEKYRPNQNGVAVDPDDFTWLEPSVGLKK